MENLKITIIMLYNENKYLKKIIFCFYENVNFLKNAYILILIFPLNLCCTLPKHCPKKVS